MNFKTTIVLLVLLVGMGTYFVLTRDRKPEDIGKVKEHKLLDIAKDSVTRLAITAGDGKQTVIEKVGDKWRLEQPVDAAADRWQADSLIDAILALTSTAEVPTSGADAPHTGLDRPQYKVELSGGGKTATLLLGRKVAWPEGVYAQVAGQKKAEVVAGDVLDKLDRAAENVRDKQLVDAASPAIKQFTIARRGQRLVLHELNGKWSIVEPKPMPADHEMVANLLAALTGMRAGEFVDDPKMAVKNPVLTVSFSTEAPSTQPATAPATGKAAGVADTVRIGDYADMNKKNIYVQLAGSGVIAKVPASVFDSLNKTALDLRDRAVVDIIPAEVSRFSIAGHHPATTQPTTQPERNTVVSVERRQVTQGPSPMINPSTKPAPDEFQIPPRTGSPWLLAGGADADQSDVEKLLDALHPLKATKHLASGPTTKPSTMYELKVRTVGAGGATSDYVAQIFDPGGEAAAIGECNGLTFELSRDILKSLDGDYVAKPGMSHPAPSHPMPPYGSTPNETSYPPGP